MEGIREKKDKINITCNYNYFNTDNRSYSVKFI